MVKFFLVKNTEVLNPNIVRESFQKTLFIRKKNQISKGWILDILKCVDSINNEKFTLNEIYKFEKNLKIKYPKDNFIKDKIRQQLQVLRDQNIIEFIGHGKYKKVNYENL